MMKRVFAIALSLLMMIGGYALAEKTLNVQGTGTVYMEADIAYASLGVTCTGEDLSVIQQQTNQTIEAICAAMEQAGLDAKSISTESINISPMYDYSDRNGDGRLTGYRIDQRLSIRTEDIDSLGAYIDAAFAAGANTFDSIMFAVKDDSQAKQDALKLAVRDASAKAAVIAEAAGEQIEGVLSISEGVRNSYYNTYAASDMMMKAESAAAGTTVRAAQINVTAEVQISYQLK